MSVSVGPNTPFTVNVELNGAADAFAVTPLRVKWDPAVLRLTDITPGDLLSRTGGTVSSIKDVRNDAGVTCFTSCLDQLRLRQPRYVR